MQVHWQVRLRDEGRPHDLLSVWQEENNRVYGAFEQGLADGRPFLAGDTYSVADIAAFPWIHRWKMQEIRLGEFPAVSAWYARVGARDAVRRGLDVPPRGDAL
jgi:GST-like protein